MNGVTPPHPVSLLSSQQVGKLRHGRASVTCSTPTPRREDLLGFAISADLGEAQNLFSTLKPQKRHTSDEEEGKKQYLESVLLPFDIGDVLE